MGELVRVDGAGAVRTVTLARPERRNALNAPMLEELTALFAVDPPADERVTVIDGAVNVGFGSTVDKAASIAAACDSTK